MKSIGVEELARARHDADMAVPEDEVATPKPIALAEIELASELGCLHVGIARSRIARGFDRETVARVERMLFLAEYKRRQAAPGVKITPRHFGRDRRYPITNRFRDRPVE